VSKTSTSQQNSYGDRLQVLTPTDAIAMITKVHVELMFRIVPLVVLSDIFLAFHAVLKHNNDQSQKKKHCWSTVFSPVWSLRTFCINEVFNFILRALKESKLSPWLQITDISNFLKCLKKLSNREPKGANNLTMAKNNNSENKPSKTGKFSWVGMLIFKSIKHYRN